MIEKPTFSKEELKMPQEHFGAQEMSVDDKPSYFGIILSILIVVLICILGGLYAWSELLKQNANLPAEQPTTSRPTAAQNNEPESTNAKADVETLSAMSTSNELDAIKADVESTTLNADSLEVDLKAIDAELR